MSSDPDSVKQQYTKIAEEIKVNLAKLDEHKVNVQRDITESEKLAKRFAEKKKSLPIRADEAHVLALYVKQALSSHSVSMYLEEIILAELMKLSALAQIDIEYKLQVPKEVEKQLTIWTEYMERAKKNWEEYIQ